MRGAFASTATRLVLGSGSPRRRQLVALLGMQTRVTSADVNERAHLLAEPSLGALSVARAKSAAIADVLDEEVLLCADSLVVADRQSLGKPADADEARAMLRRLRGREHVVMTGVTLRRANGPEWLAVVQTRVLMRRYSDAEIERYISRGEPFDKAGAYAVQDADLHPVERLEGCYLNVVGLPLCAVARGLETLGVAPSTPERGPLLPPCGYCVAGAEVVRLRA